MHIIEQLLRSKTGDSDGGDDRIVVTEHFAAVLDGATAKSDLIDPSIATRTAEDVLRALSPGATLRQYVDRVTSTLAEVFERNGLADFVTDGPKHRSSSTLAAFSRTRREIWLVGDSQARFWNQVFQTDKEIDRITSELRSLWITLERLAGTSTDELTENQTGRQFIVPLLEQQNRLRELPPEHPWSFGSLDGFPVGDEHLVVIPVPQSVREVVLATDGYPEVFDTLAQSEITLQEAIAEDPMCVARLRGTKGMRPGEESFDDRAYLRLDVSD